MKTKKKGLHSILIRFLAQNYVKIKQKKVKNRSLPRFCPFVCSNFLPKLKRSWPCRNFAYYFMLIILSWRPKGGAMAPWPPPQYAPASSQKKDNVAYGQSRVLWWLLDSEVFCWMTKKILALISDRASVTETLDLGSIPCLSFNNKKGQCEDSTL